MNKQKITIAGKQATIIYCYATEIAYKDLTGEDVADFIQEVGACIYAKPPRMPDPKRSICLIMAAMIGYYNSKGEEPPISDADIMYTATPSEMGTALGTVITLWAKFYEIPAGEPGDAADNGKGKGRKKN